MTEAPRRLVETCVASRHDSRSFGPLVAAEAQERDFYRAQRRAFVGDGQAYNWSIQRGYFPDYEPIVDLLHVLCYLYLRPGRPAVRRRSVGHWISSGCGGAGRAGWVR